MLIIHGVLDEKNEDTAAVIVKVVVNKHKFPKLTAADIRRSHRLGHLTVLHKPRPILFKLRTSDLRNDI